MKIQPGSLVFLAYTLFSILLTWPLAAGLGSDVPGDLGDSLLNMWILAWGAEHLPQLVTGAMSWSQFWDANIFHPAPLSLALSEHLLGQVLQILPIYWLTGNIILCYNLLFLATFVLSAFGAYSLVYDLTGDRRAAFIAGLVYGFLPYRIASVPHLQVLSSQWMPFALWGLNRFVTTNSYKALAGGTAALVMQNWSCGYYLLYFAPFAPLFVVHRMWALGTLRSVRTWIGLVAAATGTLILTVPFLLPYLEAQRVFGFARPFGEVVGFSANVWSYATASENLRFFGQVLRFYPRPEGETFLGIVPWLLALVALIALMVRLKPDPTSKSVASGFSRTLAVTPAQRLWRRVLIVLLAVVVFTQLVAVVSAVVFGGFDINVLGVAIRARSPGRLLWQLAVAVGLLLLASPHARAATARAVRSPVAFAAVAALLAMWLSLGPAPSAGDARVSGFGIYSALYHYVPGFDGVRVPARYAMIAGLFLAVLAGYGVAVLVRLKPDATSAPTVASGFPVRRSLGEGGSRTVATAIIAALVLVEGAAIPMEMNRAWAQNEAMPPARVYPASEVPPVYARVAALPAGSVITEFPFGDAAWEIRYVFYAASHWQPITNGYSGSFPPDYSARVARLRDVTVNPELAWQSLVDSRSTHVVVHPKAFAAPDSAGLVRAWLVAHNAQVLEQFPDGDTLFALPVNP
ncbi:MAG: hypothetical protein Q8T13_08235 [Acidobacteriota bacterium]|nr:hypothetical protein [Acidobacteriota bacterium]